MKYGIMKFDTSGDREGLYTSGRLAQERSRWRINNYGWNSSIDYFRPSSNKTPVIAVIGNSYIEGFSVEQNENLAAQLQKDFNSQYDVYSIGQAGASLAQFMNLARYAKAEFDPEVYIFVVMESDLRESLREYSSKPKELQLKYTDGKFSENSPQEFQSSKLKQWLRYSSTIWYLTSNAHLTFLGGTGNPNFDNSVNSANQINNELLQKTSDYIVVTLNQELFGKRIVFVVDGARKDIYDQKQIKSLLIAQLLKISTQNYGGYVLDLTPVFYTKYQQEHKKFNFEHDFHWDAYGYQVVTDALYKFMLDSVKIQPNILHD